MSATESEVKSGLVLPERMNPQPLARVPAEASPMAMLQIAVQRGDDIEKISKLMDLAERMQANQARMAFVEAMAKFKENPPEILKDKHVSYKKKDDSVTSYNHATLANVVSQIVTGLSSVGISHRWMTEQLEGGRIKVTCILTHTGGHSESTPLMSSPDDSGGKNNIQAIGSAVSYLQRYTLLAATGLATAEMDDDGGGSDAPAGAMTEDHADTIDSLCNEVGPTMLGKVLKSYKAESLADIPDSEYEGIVKRLNARKREGAPA